MIRFFQLKFFKIVLLSFLLIPLLLVSCGKGQKSVKSSKSGYSKLERSGKFIKGKASWYGGKFHGRKTASGERFNKKALTAAHKKLPFGTFLEVTNLRNNKKVVVRINDRGPFVRGRVLDLSKEAAKRLGMIQSGWTKVRAEILTKK